jgi:hypothetical protein
VDLVIEHPVIDERAAVQVKSRATQHVLNAFVDEPIGAESSIACFLSAIVPKGRLRPPAAEKTFICGRDASWRELHCVSE